MASTVTAILIASEGAPDPGIAMTKKIVVNWKRQLAGGNLQHHDIWSTPHSRAYQHLGPIQLYRKTMASLGWVAIDPWNVQVDEQGTVKNILDWDDFGKASDHSKTKGSIAYNKLSAVMDQGGLVCTIRGTIINN